jgi:gas vesicle protein
MRQPMQHSSKHTALAFLLGALITGGALGFTAARVFDRESRVPRSYETVREQLARTLELSAEQKARFDEILDRRDHKIDELMAPLDAKMDSLRPSVRAVRDSARHELRAVLSAAQQREYDKYIAEMKGRASRDSAEQARRRARPGSSASPADSASADSASADSASAGSSSARAPRTE